MHIILFGGSFNPPHLGHQIVLCQTFELIKNINKIWLLPDYQHAFAKNSFFAPPQHRLQMTKMLETKNIITQPCLIDQKMSGNTIDHITFLQDKYPRHQFSFLMGSDNLKSFHQWPQYKRLLKLMPFYIYPRAGFDFKPLYPNMHPLKSPRQIITNISSTLVRFRLQNKLPVKHLIPARILSYIKDQQLYA